MRLIARFAKDRGTHFDVITVYNGKTDVQQCDKNKPLIESLTKKYPAAIWFERKMFDDFGIQVEGAFDTRPLLHHERFPKNIHPMLKNFNDKSLDLVEPTAYPYERINGDGIFEVAVGPIHAGIIESGHFQFSQAGEDILHLEVRHFYKYRGIEKLLENKTLDEAKAIIERISGNESVAYQIAFFEITAQAWHVEIPIHIRKRNALLLELQRVISHLTSLGFIPNDAGFEAALAICSKLSEAARRVMQRITGHRFGFAAIGFEIKEIDIEDFSLYLDSLQKDINWFEDWITDIPSLWDRFDNTGKISLAKAIKYSTVGVVARASGVTQDTRDNQFYIDYGFEMANEKSLDVAARFKVRISEVKNSIVMMRNFLDNTNEKVIFKSLHDGEYNSFVESSLGELFMHVQIKDSLIERFFVRDPSFVNWQALHTMMDGNIIADFPLINKSCDLSYAGNDL
ncbi:MAG: hydrogenase [Helicobacteraceae bacterium CG2_30_36_10]|nr:MAG: hydrogenase [Helicobacteraceae bacterium CG2_30_36_10]